MVINGLKDFEMRDALSYELEALISLQQCVILRQEGMTLFMGRKNGKMIYIPVN